MRKDGYACGRPPDYSANPALRDMVETAEHYGLPVVDMRAAFADAVLCGEGDSGERAFEPVRQAMFLTKDIYDHHPRNLGHAFLAAMVHGVIATAAVPADGAAVLDIRQRGMPLPRFELVSVAGARVCAFANNAANVLTPVKASDASSINDASDGIVDAAIADEVLELRSGDGSTAVRVSFEGDWRLHGRLFTNDLAVQRLDSKVVFSMPQEPPPAGVRPPTLLISSPAGLSSVYLYSFESKGRGNVLCCRGVLAGGGGAVDAHCLRDDSDTDWPKYVQNRIAAAPDGAVFESVRCNNTAPFSERTASFDTYAIIVQLAKVGVEGGWSLVVPSMTEAETETQSALANKRMQGAVQLAPQPPESLQSVPGTANMSRQGPQWAPGGAAADRSQSARRFQDAGGSGSACSVADVAMALAALARAKLANVTLPTAEAAAARVASTSRYSFAYAAFGAQGLPRCACVCGKVEGLVDEKDIEEREFRRLARLYSRLLADARWPVQADRGKAGRQAPTACMTAQNLTTANASDSSCPRFHNLSATLVGELTFWLLDTTMP